MVKGEVAHRELIGSVVGLLLFPRRAPGAERTKGQAYLPTSGRRSGPPPAPARPDRRSFDLGQSPYCNACRRVKLNGDVSWHTQ